MPENISSIYAIFSLALIISSLLVGIFGLKQKILLITLLCLGALFIPLQQLPLWFYIRSVVGDLSISLTLVCAWQLGLWFFSSQGIENDKPELKNSDYVLNWKLLSWTVLATGLFLYPFALGISYFDPYAWGYHPVLLLCLSIVLLMIAYWQKQVFVVVLFSSVLLAYSLNILESNNFWDYLLDPLLFICCLSILLNKAYRSFRNKCVALS